MSEKELVISQFGENAQAYVSSSTHANKTDLEFLVALLKPEKWMSALDIATGGGHVAKHIAQKVNSVTAADISEKMLTAAKIHLQTAENINFSIADAQQLPYADVSFDIITCRIAAHHFPNPKKFINEVRRVLKPGGKLLLVDNIASEYITYNEFINKLEKLRDPSHVRSLSITEWKDIISANQLHLMYGKSRKKTLPYKEWVSRMLHKQEDIQKVTDFIFKSSKTTRNHFQVSCDANGNIVSLALDEWIAVCQKTL